MTSCTQPGCTGTIVDGYCDVCGSPGPAAATTASTATTPAYVSPPRVAGAAPAAPPAPAPAAVGNGARCTQPGCTGTIVDGYCDVCGSPPAAADDRASAPVS